MPGVRARRQQGQAIVLIALMLTVLIGMVAIAIDGSRAYALRRDMQAATDAAALAAADRLQQSGSYAFAEQGATTIFAMNMRLYTSPSCSGYGTPGASPWTVTCTFSDGTALTDVVRALGPQGSRFQLTATKTLQLQFGRVLTNGAIPTLGATSSGNVDNLLYSPALAALSQAGCGGAAGNAITVNGSGSLNVTGDVVSNGTVSIVAGGARVAGDIYSRCQSSVPGASTACYPSGASSPCTYPDVAGATRAGYQLADPGFTAPASGGSQGFSSSNVVVPAGTYAFMPVLTGGHCWFLSGGVFTFPAGVVNSGDFVSNELKPPDEPDASSNTTRSASQFWNTNGVQCAGSTDISIVGGPRGIPVGNWAFLLTSVRTDTYAGVTYVRESAPSMCYPQNVNNSGENVVISVSNVPGASSYNIYASPPTAGGTCTGLFGLVTSLPVTSAVQNNNTTPCPLPSGGGCSLGNENIRLDSTLLSSGFTPNAAAAPGASGSYPPDPEQAPLAAELPNQNPGRGVAAAGDRANENNCKSVAGAYVTCPGPITPGAVELYFPAGGCLVTGNGGDTYVFSGYQYRWVSVYEPLGNTCANTLGAASNSAYIGLFYSPSASVNITSQASFRASGMGGIIAGTIGFTGLLPTIVYKSDYAPAPPASRLIA
jgi:Flp pilus assembly protein TadG